MASLQRPDRPRAPHRLRRAAGWAVLWLSVLLAHWALLRALTGAPGAPASQPEPARAARVPVSLLVPLPGAQPPAAVPRSMPAAAPLPKASRPLPLPSPPVAATVPAPQPLAADAAAAPSGESAGEPIPVYATQLPEPARLSYRLQRGERVGHGSLQWQRDDTGYRLLLHSEWPGQPAQGSASRGVVDADGVAPVRHAELRREREVRAVNFQREAGLISFSGPQARYPLRAGAQDRLSWMIQLPAIVQADSGLVRPGAQVTLFVAGTRGDAEAWRFEVLGRESLQLPAGDVADALQLRREPSRPYDTRVEVWLDPARGHLPVRARFTTLPGGTPLELTLLAADDASDHLEKAPAGPR